MASVMDVSDVLASAAARALPQRDRKRVMAASGVTKLAKGKRRSVHTGSGDGGGERHGVELTEEDGEQARRGGEAAMAAQKRRRADVRRVVYIANANAPGGKRAPPPATDASPAKRRVVFVK